MRRTKSRDIRVTVPGGCGASPDWQGVPLKLSVFDPRDERLALKTTAAGACPSAQGWPRSLRYGYAR